MSAASPSPRPDRIRDAILCRIPAFRPVAIKLLQILDDEESSVLDVADMLNSDPALSAEVLTMANSALYAGARHIDTISQAVMLLGTDRTRALASKAALYAMHRALGSQPVVERSWTHSRAAAVIAGWLAPFFRVHPDGAYTAGLLHDIGRLGLLALNSPAYAKILDQTTGTTRDLLAAEETAFRVDHCRAGLWLIRTWGLPEEFGVASQYHHQDAPVAQNAVAELARLACAMAETIGHPVAPMIRVPPLEALLDQVPELDRPGARYPLSTLATRLEEELGGSEARSDSLIRAEVPRGATIH